VLGVFSQKLSGKAYVNAKGSCGNTVEKVEDEYLEFPLKKV